MRYILGLYLVLLLVPSSGCEDGETVPPLQPEDVSLRRTTENFHPKLRIDPPADDADFRWYFIAVQSYLGILSGDPDRAPGRTFNREFDLQRASNWTFDQSLSTGQLVFQKDGTPSVSFDVQIAGTYDIQAQTWKWAWANDSISHHLKRGAELTKEFGIRNGGIEFESEEELKRWEEKVRRDGGIPFIEFHGLTTPDGEADELGCLINTAFVAYLIKSKGFFVAREKDNLIFMVITDYLELK